MSLKWKKHKYYLILLTAVFFVLIYLFVPEGSVFGSNTDWMSQHATLAETLRDACRSQGTIFPDFLWLGGGSSAYEFSYYGYLRPDILLGCLLPQVPMIYLLIASMMACVLASGLLGYALLIQNRIEPYLAFIGSVFLMTAGCFFQAHRQVMFINYMPWELLALLLLPRLVEKGRYTLFTVMLTLVIYNSFYYSITVLAVMAWRTYELTRDKRRWLLCLRSMAVAVALAGVLLLPTALVLLEHRRQGAPLSLAELFLPDVSMEGLLYSPYGMGLTLFALYALLAGLTVRGALRKRSVMLLIAVLLPAVSWILNGTLYARAKILMPLLPLAILQMTVVLQMIWKRQLKIRIWPELLFGAAALLYAGQTKSGYLAGVLLDVVVLVIVLWLARFYNRRRVYAMLLAAPLVCSVYTARQDHFVSDGMWVSPFSEDEIKAVATDPWARMDGMEQPLISANRLLWPGQKSTTMYSSITNEEYSHWFFDILRMPIRINNRIALLCEANPFQEYLMGVKYLQTTEGKVPAGYEIRARKGKSVLAENDQALPIAYLSTETIGRQEFDSLEFPYTLEALLRYTVTEEYKEDTPGEVRAGRGYTENDPEIEGGTGSATDPGTGGGTGSVPDSGAGGSTGSAADSGTGGGTGNATDPGTGGGAGSAADPGTGDVTERRADGKKSFMEKKTPLFSEAKVSDHLEISRSEDKVTVEAKKSGGVTMTLEEPVKDRVVILEFHVKSKDGKRVTIDINGTRNRLSSANAAYPNGNDVFTYYLTAPEGEALEKLEITCSDGSYELSDFSWYEFPLEKLEKEDAVPVTMEAVQGNTVLKCRTSGPEDSCFVTSIPWKNGFEIYVDGEKAQVEKVNTAFVGTKLAAGEHTVELRFTPPGKKAGMAVSAAGILLLILFPAWDRKKRNKQR